MISYTYLKYNFLLFIIQSFEKFLLFIIQSFEKFKCKLLVTYILMPKKNKRGEIVFSDHPEFTPNLTPREIFKSGGFGGTYWRPIYSGVIKKHLKDQHKEFPESWWKDIPESYLTSVKCDKSINKYKVTSGTSLKFWESKNWITEQDPYGWVQWYCRFYKGRRSNDDERQIKRWLNFTGPKGRFRVWYYNKVRKANTTYDDQRISPVIKQGLLQWAYAVNERDFKEN